MARPVGVLTGMALNFAVSLTLAVASWELFESPILKGRWPWSPAAKRQIA